MRAKVFFLVLLFLVAGCGKKEKPFKPKGEAKVKKGSIVLEVTATGAVKPQVGAQVKVGTRISGKVEKLYAQAGDLVKKGQLIAVIEHEDLKADMLAKKHQMEAALQDLKRVEQVYPLRIEAQKNAVKKAQAELHLAELNFERVKQLHRDGLVSDNDLDVAIRDLKVKEALLNAEKNRLFELKREFEKVRKEAHHKYEAAKEAYKFAKIRYGYAFVYSPITGIVSSVSTQQGETVVAGLSAPTFITVVDLKKLQVDAYIDETDIGKIEPGQKVTFVVDAYPDKTFEGIVETIYPGAIVRNNVVFYDTKIRIITPYYPLLKPEMTADVTVEVGRKDNVLIVPSAAVKVGMDGRSYVMVKKNGKWVKRPVKTGWESQGKVEILEGLREGEVVALW